MQEINNNSVASDMQTVQFKQVKLIQHGLHQWLVAAINENTMHRDIIQREWVYNQEENK